jgi:DNA repair exonuclease SbcCD ATPase subunit
MPRSESLNLYYKIVTESNDLPQDGRKLRNKLYNLKKDYEGDANKIPVNLLQEILEDMHKDEKDAETEGKTINAKIPDETSLSSFSNDGLNYPGIKPRLSNIRSNDVNRLMIENHLIDLSDQRVAKDTELDTLKAELSTVRAQLSEVKEEFEKYLADGKINHDNVTEVLFKAPIISEIDLDNDVLNTESAEKIATKLGEKEKAYKIANKSADELTKLKEYLSNVSDLSDLKTLGVNNTFVEHLKKNITKVSDLETKLRNEEEAHQSALNLNTDLKSKLSSVEDELKKTLREKEEANIVANESALRLSELETKLRNEEEAHQSALKLNTDIKSKLLSVENELKKKNEEIEELKSDNDMLDQDFKSLDQEHDTLIQMCLDKGLSISINSEI